MRNNLEMTLKIFHKGNVLFRLFLLNFYFVPLFIFSQADTTKDKTELVDIYLSVGRSDFPVFLMSQGDFKQIVPKSLILSGDIMKADFNDFNNDTAGGFNVANVTNAIYAQGGITLRLKNKEFKKAGPWLKLGLNYFASSAFLNTGVFNSKSTNDDSLYFVNAIPVSRNTENRHSVVYGYSCQSLNFESTLIYKVNPTGIFCLFGGPGAILGANFDGKAKLISTREIFINDYLFSSGKTLYKSDYQKIEEIKEEFNFRPNLCFGLFINIGLDLRLARNYDVIKNIHLFAEAKPMFRAYGVKGAGFQSSVILVVNAGLRYEFE
ncbi:MAG: hypothetical protein V4635_08005 [Bacteroidota bacterium]